MALIAFVGASFRKPSLPTKEKAILFFAIWVITPIISTIIGLAARSLGYLNNDSAPMIGLLTAITLIILGREVVDWRLKRVTRSSVKAKKEQ